MSVPTPDIEDRVRRSLRTWADEVEPAPGDPYDAMGRVTDDGPSRSRWALAAVAAAIVLLVVVTVGVVARAGRDGVDVDPAVTTPTQPAPAVHVDLGAIPYVVFEDDGWSVSRMTISPPPVSPRPNLALELVGPESRTIRIVVGPLGVTGPGSSPLPSETLTVRGQPAFETDEGADRYRVTWDEAGVSWMADGEPFASRDEMVAVIDHLRIVDEPTWQAWLAPEARAILTGHPGDGVDYYSGVGAATVATDSHGQRTAMVLGPGGVVRDTSGETVASAAPVPVPPTP